MLANLLITLAKFIGFLVTGSSGLLAESVHSLADSLNQILLLFGVKRSKRIASKTHQFGYGKERYFYSFIVALTIFLLGGIFAIYEAFTKIINPHQVEEPLIAITILVVALVTESFSLRTAVKESNLMRKKGSWSNFIKFSKNPELPVVLLEDLAALLGLSFALAGLLLSISTHNYIFDAFGTLGIGLLLIAVALVLGIEMKSLLLGEAVIEEEEKMIYNNLQSFTEIEKVLSLKTLHLAPDEILLAVKLAVNPDLTMRELSILTEKVERKIRKSNSKIKFIYLEPAVYKKRNKFL